MLRVDNLETFNWEGATRGMRNAFKSWTKGDSFWKLAPDCSKMVWIFGPNDYALATRLGNADLNSHAKFLRQLIINCDITAPMYWWKQFDTYKVGTVANSESTMHTLMKERLTLDDFSIECAIGGESSIDIPCQNLMQNVLGEINYFISRYKDTKDKTYFDAVVQLLPMSFNQLRTVTFNYQVAKNIWYDRHSHKLGEWHTLCDIFETQLPYFKELCLSKTKEEEA